MTPNIGLRTNFQWLFTVADVKFPILGADFLAHYELTVDLSKRELTDKMTKLTNYSVI